MRSEGPYGSRPSTAMRNSRILDSLPCARLACLLLAGALGLSGLGGCCGPYGARPVCNEPGDVACCPPGHGRRCLSCPGPSTSRGCFTSEPAACPSERGGHRKPVHRLAHHLKPDGPLQPQVPMAPLPKFHPLPVKPVFEPGYFDTVIGPAEAAPSYGPAELAPVPPTPTPNDF